ncbi:hypothetical protein ECZU51_47290 [Escherichia coli]|nr:hypothetical protein ECZU51_47290 [Escherichia coli]
MTLLPFIQPDARSLQLLFSMNLSDKPTFEVFESGGSRAQVPTVDLKTINQTIDLKSGQTVILSGFRQSGSKSVRRASAARHSSGWVAALTAVTMTPFWLC